MVVRVGYIDGRTRSALASEWSSLDPEGVDWVEIGVKRFTRASGYSLYWVYPEGPEWVMGAGPVGYGRLPPEVIVSRDDDHSTRSIDSMPDLPLSVIKLGWWRPGEERPPWPEPTTSATQPLI